MRRLLAAQLPEWAELPLEPVLPMGTDNALFRLGDGMVVRLPRKPRAAVTLQKELLWLPRLAAHLPLAVPVPLAAGAPAEGYPFEWAVYTRLDGEDATVAPVHDSGALAEDLARFVGALQRIDPTGGPPPGEHNFFRGEPLARRDAATRAAIVSLGVDAARAVWDEAIRAPEWTRPGVWIHGDLDARNLLVADGRLSGIVDFGGLGVGDPACDVMVAWKVLPAGARGAFRAALSIDDATWARARGWALSQAVVALSSYTIETNAALVREARRWLAEVLDDRGDLTGIVQPGRGLGAGLMADDAVMERLRELAGFPIVPGTLNVRLPAPLQRGPSWRYVPAAEVAPDWEARSGQTGYYLASVTIAGRYRGLAFQAVEPEGPGYPLDQVELFSEVHLRSALGLRDGDPIVIAVQ